MTEAEALPIVSSGDFVRQWVPADYVIYGVVRQGWLYTFTAPTGHGKTAVTLSITEAIASGRHLGSVEVKRGRVLYLAGENPDDVRARWIAMCERSGVDPDFAPGGLHPGLFLDPCVAPDARRALCVRPPHGRDRRHLADFLRRRGLQLE